MYIYIIQLKNKKHLWELIMAIQNKWNKYYIGLIYNIYL